MTHLFLFTITPVQSFIMQARKTQDLWAGSRMLSDLIKAVINEIGQEKIIFPNVDGKDLTKIDSLSNRILAEFDFQKTDEELQQLGRSIEKVISSQIDILIDKAKVKINKVNPTEYSNIKIEFEKQLKDYFSTFWVFVKVENNDYMKAYEEADRLLGAIKNSRTFTQNPEQGRKCSLSGEQNALVFQHVDKEKDEKKKDENLKNRRTQLEKRFVSNCALVSDNSFGDSEGLSAISYLKRTYEGASSFDSTAKIALLKDLSIFSNGYLDEYKRLLGRNFDEQLYFEENLTPKYFTKHKLPLKKLSEAKKQLSRLNYIAKKQGRAFTKYYAILLFDADSMGAWLSGDYLTEKKDLYHFHKHISSLLSSFAEYAKGYVDGNGDDQTKKGRTVYAGGDDYLGFINLHYLFDVVRHLREQFKIKVSDNISDNGKYTIIPNLKTGSSEMSFSAGISIAHYKTPLSEVLTWARKMEKEAKDTTYKNSFGVAALKKSGEIHKFVLSFKDSDGNYFSDSLSEIIRYISTEMYSSKFINSLERELSLFGGGFDYRGRIMRAETKRLVENSRNKQKTSKNENESLASILELIYDGTDSRTNHEDNHFHTTLSICDFINRKLKGND